jgi:hypothetical protein
MQTLKLTQIGNSVGVILPKERLTREFMKENRNVLRELAK